MHIPKLLQTPINMMQERSFLVLSQNDLLQLPDEDQNEDEADDGEEGEEHREAEAEEGADLAQIVSR